MDKPPWAMVALALSVLALLLVWEYQEETENSPTDDVIIQEKIKTCMALHNAAAATRSSVGGIPTVDLDKVPEGQTVPGKTYLQALTEQEPTLAGEAKACFEDVARMSAAARKAE